MIANVLMIDTKDSVMIAKGQKMRKESVMKKHIEEKLTNFINSRIENRERQKRRSVLRGKSRIGSERLKKSTESASKKKQKA